MHAHDESSNNKVSIENGDISIAGGAASGVGASNGGKNEVIGTGSSTITISGASGVSANGLGSLNTPASNAIIGGDGKVSITGQQGSAVSATNNGANYVFGKDIDIVGVTAGIFASGGSINEVTGTGTVTITGANGLEANLGGHNDVEAHTLNLTATAAGMKSNGGKNIVSVDTDAMFTVNGDLVAAGMHTTTGQQELTAGGQVVFNVTAARGDASGISGSGAITAGGVSMTIKGDLSALIMNGGGTITANSIDLTSQSANNASGMVATAGTVNTIQSQTGQALDLTMSTLQGVGKGTAMSADSGTNIIRGNSQNGGSGDNITINGDLSAKNAGQNIITTGAGNDRIVVNGDISKDGNAGSQNTISSGEGDDVIVINGAISGTGALYVDGGSGYNTLVLHAETVDEFISRYAVWLNSLDADILKGIQSIEFSGVNSSDLLGHPDLAIFFQYAQDNSIVVGDAVAPIMAASDLLAADDPLSEESSALFDTSASVARFSALQSVEAGDSQNTQGVEATTAAGNVDSDADVATPSLFWASAILYEQGDEQLTEPTGALSQGVSGENTLDATLLDAFVTGKGFFNEESTSGVLGLTKVLPANLNVVEDMPLNMSELISQPDLPGNEGDLDQLLQNALADTGMNPIEQVNSELLLLGDGAPYLEKQPVSTEHIGYDSYIPGGDEAFLVQQSILASIS